jgi:hypothetical protein
MKKLLVSAASIGGRIVIVLLLALLIKPKCDNVHFYEKGKCLEYCADGDWSRVEFCKKHVEVEDAGWACVRRDGYNNATKCTDACFEIPQDYTLLFMCDKVVY